MRAKFARGLCTSCVQSVGDYILWLLPKYMGRTQDVWRRVPESNRSTRICNMRTLHQASYLYGSDVVKKAVCTILCTDDGSVSGLDLDG